MVMYRNALIGGRVLLQDLKCKFNRKLSGDSQIVVALVLIAVAIGLCIIFRNQIFTIMTNLFTTIGNQINALTEGAVTGASTGGE